MSLVQLGMGQPVQGTVVGNALDEAQCVTGHGAVLLPPAEIK